MFALDTARLRAAEADKALAKGQNWGPLHGLPMTVKDVFEVAGMPATSPKCTRLLHSNDKSNMVRISGENVRF